MTLLTERASRVLAKGVIRDAAQRSAMIEATRRNAETIAAMGMSSALAKRWSVANERYVSTIEKASDVVTSHGTVTKIVRLLLQSTLLGFGAYLVIIGELLPGAMIAAKTGRHLEFGKAEPPARTCQPPADARNRQGASHDTHGSKPKVSPFRKTLLESLRSRHPCFQGRRPRLLRRRHAVSMRLGRAAAV